MKLRWGVKNTCRTLEEIDLVDLGDEPGLPLPPCGDEDACGDEDTWWAPPAGGSAFLIGDRTG